MEPIIKGNQNTTKLLNELKKSSKQYPCLNKEEERALIEKYRNDREKLNKLLFMHNIRSVFSQAKNFVGKVNDFDSLVQDGMVGLAEAAKRFDIDRDIKFCTYCVIWIRKYLLAHFYGRQVELDKLTSSLNSPTLINKSKSSSGSNDVTFENYVNEYIDPSCDSGKTIHDELSSVEQSEICKVLYDRLEHDSSLSATDKAVFTDLFVNKEKTRDIADKYDIVPEKIMSIKQKILTKFKTILVNEYKIESFYDLA